MCGQESANNLVFSETSRPKGYKISEKTKEFPPDFRDFVGKQNASVISLRDFQKARPSWEMSCQTKNQVASHKQALLAINRVDDEIAALNSNPSLQGLAQKRCIFSVLTSDGATGEIGILDPAHFYTRWVLRFTQKCNESCQIKLSLSSNWKI